MRMRVKNSKRTLAAIDQASGWKEQSGVEALVHQQQIAGTVVTVAVVAVVVGPSARRRSNTFDWSEGKSDDMPQMMR